MVGSGAGGTGGREWRVLRDRSRLTAALVALVAGLTLAACGTPAGASLSPRPRPADDPPAAGSFYSVPAPLAPQPPGSVIRSDRIDPDIKLPAGATAYRVIYYSETISGADVAVSGLVVVPGGRPPVGGFPIVSWSHGTTGLADQCAPSLEGLGSISYLVPLLNRRMIVVATDYQGLGAPSGSPYLVGQSEGQNVLDAARAARALVGGAASNQVVVIGYSQGGQAALFAGQIAQSYAPELFLAGVVAVGPVASISELAPADLSRHTDPDAAFAAMALTAWSKTYGNLAVTSVLSRSALAHSSVMSSGCVNAVATAYDSLSTTRIFRPGWSSDPGVVSDDTANQPGHAPIFAPVLVVQGTDDQLIPYRSTTRLVQDSLCGDQHDTVEYVPEPDASHSGALTQGASTILGWVKARLAGRPATDGCVKR
jgi:pimeloyl-ACP methyl ester carboxylesterase